MATRNQIDEAILAKINAMVFADPIMGLSTWATVEDKLRLWADVPSAQQPYACLVSHSEELEYRGLGLYRRRLPLTIYCYSKAPPGVSGRYDLNTMLEAFEATFGQAAVDNFSTNQCTLGGLVYFCRIEGKPFKDPGDIDYQALMVLRLMVEMP